MNAKVTEPNAMNRVLTAADEILVLLISHDGDDSPAVALARNRAELLQHVKIAVWGEPHPADTTNDAGDDMAEGITDTLLETGVMAFEGDPPLRLVRIPVQARQQPGEWAEAERIRNLPEVDEAFHAFLDDNTGDNATCLVRAVMRAHGVALPRGGQQAWTDPEKEPRFQPGEET
jgi:hypothetical protein